MEGLAAISTHSAPGACTALIGCPRRANPKVHQLVHYSMRHAVVAALSSGDEYPVSPYHHHHYGTVLSLCPARSHSTAEGKNLVQAPSRPSYHGYVLPFAVMCAQFVPLHLASLRERVRRCQRLSVSPMPCKDFAANETSTISLQPCQVRAIHRLCQRSLDAIIFSVP